VCLLLTGAEFEGNTIPEAVPVEGVVPETQEAAGAATKSVEIASEGAPGVAEEERDEVLPDSSLEVVIRLPEIQDAEPIRSALLMVNSCIKVRLDLQADNSPVVVKGPFFPRVVNPRYRIRGTMCNARIQSSKAR
jgi:hypothetical protein